MKLEKIKEAAESGGIISGMDRGVSGMTKGEYAPDGTIQQNVGQTPQKAATDLFPFEIGNLKNQLADITYKAFSLRSQFAAALENPSIKKTPSKSVVIKQVISELDNLNKSLIEKIPQILEIF